MKNRDSASKRLITSSLGWLEEEEEDSLEEELGSMEDEDDGAAEEGFPRIPQESYWPLPGIPFVS